MRHRILYAMLGLGLIYYLNFTGQGYRHPAGILIEETPVQSETSERKKWKIENTVITPLAKFDIKARVLSRSRYRFDRAAYLAPVDLALGWGPMSDTSVLEKLKIRQSVRYYSWYTRDFPVARSEITSNSANMHIIPADAHVRRVLLEIDRDDLVHIRGYLVKAERADGFRWQSSMTRLDTGGGACEIIWAESIRQIPDPQI